MARATQLLVVACRTEVSGAVPSGNWLQAATASSNRPGFSRLSQAVTQTCRQGVRPGTSPGKIFLYHAYVRRSRRPPLYQTSRPGEHFLSESRSMNLTRECTGARASSGVFPLALGNREAGHLSIKFPRKAAAPEPRSRSRRRRSGPRSRVSIFSHINWHRAPTASSLSSFPCRPKPMVDVVTPDLAVKRIERVVMILIASRVSAAEE